MAFNSRRIDPLDLQPRKAIGVSLPFTGKAVFNPTYQTKDAIRTNIINFFLTEKRERVLNPSLGTDLRSLLFENINQDILDRVNSIVRLGLDQYFPTIVINRLEVIDEPNNNIITLFLKYSIRDTNIDDEVVINFEQ